MKIFGQIALMNDTYPALAEALASCGARVKSKNDLSHYFEFCLESKKDKALYPLIIISKKSNSTIGLTMFGNISFQNKRLEMGWTWIGERFQGTGIKKFVKDYFWIIVLAI